MKDVFIVKNEEREDRIIMEVVVDAYDSEERAMAWYYYVAEECSFPFNAKCISEERKSPLQKGDIVEVIDISPADECVRVIYMDIQWNDRKLAVPLSQLEGIGTSEVTRQVIEDWHYWVKMGYQF